MTRTSARTLSWTWLALLVLAGASFALSYAHLGGAGVPVALGIAAVKATLVVLVFMELSSEPFTVRITLVAGVLFVLLLLGFTVGDVLTRPSPPLLPPAPPFVLRP